MKLSLRQIVAAIVFLLAALAFLQAGQALRDCAIVAILWAARALLWEPRPTKSRWINLCLRVTAGVFVVGAVGISTACLRHQLYAAWIGFLLLAVGLGVENPGADS